MPVSKAHRFEPWEDWRGEKEEQPCVVCGFTRGYRHHNEHVHRNLDRHGYCVECGTRVLTTFRGYPLPDKQII